MTTIGLLHPGAMGAAVGAALVDVGHTVLWASNGRSAASADRARAAGLRDVHGVTSLVAQAEVVLSICPPDRAREVAAECREFTGIYVDANAIAPATARDVSTGVTRYVDGGIIGSPPTRPGMTRLYLSGPDATAVAALFAGCRLEARVLDGDLTAASALKLTYAAWTKGSAALLLAIEQAATAAGVDGALHAEWALSQPALVDRLTGAAAAADEKGWRWIGEMHEIAAMFAALGQPDGFHTAAAQVYEARSNSLRAAR